MRAYYPEFREIISLLNNEIWYLFDSRICTC